MTSKQAWDIFEQTGNIEAYLLYVQLKSEEKGEKNEPEIFPGEPYFEQKWS